ncbi:outer membrane usher protein [Pantoea sp. CTOTU50773]|uniref:outer membrane usher protein n=1 Tax=Pantoea sp. CTOTU50773 TaxID=2953853 RepID=UPI0028AAB98D|nr:outer membrane usher protein [Pantoea sp. CTOTU50773]
MLMRFFWHAFAISLISILVFFSCILGARSTLAGSDIQFNTDVLDLKDRSNIDISQFARKGFILPGAYTLAININSITLPERVVNFYASEENENETLACITQELIPLLGLKDKFSSQLQWWHHGECLNLNSVAGMSTRADLGKSTLLINIPQAFLEYSSSSWDPPARWEEGIAGALFDYNLNFQTIKQNAVGSKSHTNLSGNGTTGANLGAWRVRADWQGRYDHQSAGGGAQTPQNWDWNRFYAFRAIKRLGAKLTLGEDYLNSSIFDGFRFTGLSLATDDNMLPPNLRGYAPEISGVAKSNAKVIISQQGRVIKEVQVAAGPYRIQDLDSAVSGNLDVRIEEQDGNIEQFQVNTATIPYLTRPGQIRYKSSIGRPSNFAHHTEGPLFATGELSWGISNGWSLYTGGMGGGDYHALSLGVGRDLLALGAISTDVTVSNLKDQNRDTQRGNAWRASYAKRFEDTGSQVSFAGYRFSDDGFRSMGDYLNGLKGNVDNGRSKEMYTVSLNQQFESLNLATYLNYNHQTYWNQQSNDRYDFSLSKNMDLMKFKNVSLSLTAYRSALGQNNDKGVYMSLSLPWGQSGTASYNNSYSKGNNLNSVSYYDRMGDADSYQISAGVANSDADIGGYYTHKGSLAQLNTSVSYRESQYQALGMSLQGGATLTPNGGAFHSSSVAGRTRMLVDTDGVAGVPVSGFGHSINTNYFGKAVITDINSYYRNSIRINLDKLADDIEVMKSVSQGTLTEGAIGYRRFNVTHGGKAIATVRLEDGSAPPFGASVFNLKNQETGIINDDGNVYLSGIQPGEAMTVRWNNADQCTITPPLNLTNEITTNLLLPCIKV